MFSKIPVLKIAVILAIVGAVYLVILMSLGSSPSPILSKGSPTP
jgi:hypothetical protein